jgi:Asp-tRNA(Asn)/Glu-tRNA(Gln) amidotransferase A subunit family amidase
MRVSSGGVKPLVIRAISLPCFFVGVLAAQTSAPFRIEEATIAQIQAAFKDGSLTCRTLVERYLRRIDAFDKNGPALNAIVMTNPDALKAADELDRRFRQSGPVGPMHCVPVLVKDNYETIDMPTTAGSLSLKGMMTGKDAFVVKRLRDAGALMIAKSNMAEFAFSPVETVNSIQPGAAVLQVIAGEDSSDPATAAIRGRAVPKYSDALGRDGLRGARLGVLRQAYDTPTLDREVNEVFQRAIGELRDSGADVIDPAEVDGLDALRRTRGGGCNQFKYGLNRYLAGLGDRAPVHSIEEIVKSRQFHPSIQGRLESAQSSNDVPGESPGCRSRDEFREKLRVAVLKLMSDQRLDALIYPTWSNPPRLIGDLNTPGGDNNQFFSPSTGFPAMTVPMGYTRGDTLPAGLQFFGRPWDEPTLLRLAYSYEQHTHHRRPPVATAPLR